MLRVLGCSLLAVLVSIPVRVAGQSASADSVPTIRTTSELVVVDVVATDAQQNPMLHLPASDFAVSEDGHTQAIKVFEEHAADTPSPLPPLPKFAPGKFTNYSAAPTNGAINILLLDKLNTPMIAQSVVRDQVLKYLKAAPAGTRIAIFALTTQLRLLQGFTSDPVLLRTLVEGKKGIAGASPLLAGGAPGGDNMSTDTVDNANNDVFGNSPDADTVLTNLQQFEAQQQSFQTMLRARYTLDAFNQLARYLSSLPGRKNLIWFSGSFPISILPDADLQDPFSAVASSEDEFRQTVNLLSRSQVAVYPVDARQLMSDPALNAASSGRNVVKNPGQAEQKFFLQTTAEHGAMNRMAEATGGKAFVDTNDLKAAIGRAIEAGSNYYTLAYAPTNRNQNGNYRKIEVKLDRPGVKLAYRRGYFTDEPSTPKHQDNAQDAMTDTATYNPLRTAMLRGAPDPDEIVFIADVRPSSADTELELAQGNRAAPKLSGPYRRYTVTFALNPKDFRCDVTQDSTHHCVMEFQTYVYDNDGVLINMQTDAINAGFTSERYAAFLKSPLAYRQQISVPTKGEYYLRVGLRDDTADHVGALELPVASVAKLPPASTLAPAPGLGTSPRTAQK
jgi:VWFA-related protein